MAQITQVTLSTVRLSRSLKSKNLRLGRGETELLLATETNEIRYKRAKSFSCTSVDPPNRRVSAMIASRSLIQNHGFGERRVVQARYERTNKRKRGLIEFAYLGAEAARRARASGSWVLLSSHGKGYYSTDVGTRNSINKIRTSCS